MYYFICFRSGISQIVFQDLSNSNAPALLQGLFLLPKSYVFYESVVIREGSFMVFTLKDLTADTYTEVTVVQKEDGTIVSNEERMLNNQHEYLICDDDSPWNFPWGYSSIWDVIRTLNHAELPYPMESDEMVAIINAADSSSFSDVVGKISEGEVSLITPEEMKNPENRDMCEQNLALYLVRNGMYQLPFEYSDELEEYLRWNMISEEIQINGNWELVKVNNRWFAVSIEV